MYIRGMGPGVGLVCALLLSPVTLAQWQVDLVEPVGSFYRPGDAYAFTLPPDMPAEVLQRLSLELDDIDVTAFIRREGDQAVFTPPQALAYGTHRLRLVEALPDGSIVERSLWQVEVRQTHALREAGFEGHADLASAQRPDDKNVASNISSNQRQGGMSLDGRIADDDWQLRARGGLIHNSQIDQMPNDRRTDLAHGLVEAGKGAVMLRAGDHTIPATSLVMRDFARRGISGRARSDGLRSELTAFAMRTETINGFRHGFGTGDSANRSDGVMLTTQPLATRPERLQVSALYLNAEGNPFGSSTAGYPESVRNDAAALAVDSLTFDQRVRLRGEYARSDTDFDGAGTLVGDESDSAHSLLAQYQPPQRELRGDAFGWNVGAEHSEVGPWFYSLANPALPADKRLDRAFSGFTWGGLSVNAQAARETDNVDDDSHIPRLRTDYFTLGGNYTPFRQPAETGVGRLFNGPSFAFIAQRMAQTHTDVPAAFGGHAIDQDTEVVYAGARFSPGNWSWDLAHTRTWFDDTAGLQADYTNDLSELGVDMMLSDRISLSPRIQYNRLDDRDNGVATRTVTAMLGASAALIPGKLDASLNYALNRERADDDSLDNDSYSVDALLNWTLIQPRENRPGLSLFASGSYFDDRNATGSSTDLYQIFAGLRIGWPVAY